MDKEIEVKFDVDTNPNEIFNKEDFIYAFQLISKSKGYIPSDLKQITRRFTYFDDRTFGVYKAGATIRKIEGFDPLKDRARMRFDIKMGGLENRSEESIWSSKDIDVNEGFKKYFKLIGVQGKLYPTAQTATSDIKFNLNRNGSIIEASLDYVAIINGLSFKELELELKEGDRRELEDLVKIAEDSFSLKRLNKQKYSRIIESIHPELIEKLRGREYEQN